MTRVPMALRNRAEIDRAYREAAPLGETPTGDALDVLLDETALDPSSAPRVFVLATDGEPDRCGAPNGHDEISRRRSVEAVERAHREGIRTFVVGVGRGTVSTRHLEDLARAGSGGRSARYFEAGTVAELAEAMRTIVRGEISCVLEIEGRVDPAMACDGDVRLNGRALRCGDDGWRPRDATHIELLGRSCDALVENERTEVEAIFPCTVVLI